MWCILVPSFGRIREFFSPLKFFITALLETFPTLGRYSLTWLKTRRRSRCFCEPAGGGSQAANHWLRLAGTVARESARFRWTVGANAEDWNGYLVGSSSCR
jgi:hypothetical protein